MIEYALNAPTSILLRELYAKDAQPTLWCEMCLRDGKATLATHLFHIKSTRYYAVCDKCYNFLTSVGSERKENGTDNFL